MFFLLRVTYSRGRYLNKWNSSASFFNQNGNCSGQRLRVDGFRWRFRDSHLLDPIQSTGKTCLIPLNWFLQ